MLLPDSALLKRQYLFRADELGLALLRVLGLIVQVPAVGASYALMLQRTYQDSPAESYGRIYYQPKYFPLIGQWTNYLQVTANLREAAAYAQLATLLDQTEREDDFQLLTDTPSQALRIQRQTVLSFNLPSLWLVSAPWLQRGGST